MESRQERAVREALEALDAEDGAAQRSAVTRKSRPAPVSTPGETKPQSPAEWIAGGVGISLLGGLMIGMGVNGVPWMVYVGAMVAALAWVPVTAGVIGLGVRLGMRWHRYESDRG